MLPAARAARVDVIQALRSEWERVTVGQAERVGEAVDD